MKLVLGLFVLVSTLQAFAGTGQIGSGNVNESKNVLQMMVGKYSLDRNTKVKEANRSAYHCQDTLEVQLNSKDFTYNQDGSSGAQSSTLSIRDLDRKKVSCIDTGIDGVWCHQKQVVDKADKIFVQTLECSADWGKKSCKPNNLIHSIAVDKNSGHLIDAWLEDGSARPCVYKRQ